MREGWQRELLETVSVYMVVLLAGVIGLRIALPETPLFTQAMDGMIALAVLAVAVSWVARDSRPARQNNTARQGAPSVPAMPTQTSAAPSRPPLTDTARASLAVLPLENLSDDDDDINMAQGFSAEIIRALAGVSGLRVASYQQSLSYSHMDIQEITRELDVRYILSGSMQRSGERIRVIVMLTDAHKRSQLWTESYARSIDDLFEVQSEIAEAIAVQVGSQYISEISADIARELPQNLSAWGLVHKGMNFWISAYTREASEETLSLLREAIKLEPQYALAHAELGFIHSQRVLNAFTDNAEEEISLALSSVNRAYELAPRDPTVMERTGLVWFNCGLRLRSIKLLREVVRMSPYNLVAWGYLGNSLGMGGDRKQVDEARGIFARLLAIAPEHPSVPFWNYFSANTYAQAEEWPMAVQFAASAVEFHPGFCIGWFALANANGSQGDVERARQAEAAARKGNPLFSFQAYYEYMVSVSAEWHEPHTHYRGLLETGLIEESTS